MKNTAYYSNQAQKQQVMFHEWQDEDEKLELARYNYMHRVRCWILWCIGSNVLRINLER